MEHELNARSLSFKEIGDKFIVHPAFKDLLNVNNSIVIGPRGSGKTTMLKMLTPEAQDNWSPSKEFEYLKDSMTFLGIYIPMSRIFQEELDARIELSNLDDDKTSNLLLKLYYLNVVESILELIEYLFAKNSFDSDQIQAAIILLGPHLKFDTRYCYKLTSLFRNVVVEKLRIKQNISTSNYEEDVIYSNSLISLLEPVLRVINEIFNFKSSTKYSFCFDELDVYPSVFSAELIRNLRGISSNIILKLTIAPIHRIQIASITDTPQGLHDYDKIYLWPNFDIRPNMHFANSEFLRFSEELAEQTLYHLTGREYSLKSLLGEFDYRRVFEFMKTYETDDNPFKAIMLEKFSNDELNNYVFLQLAKYSENFKSFLVDKHNLKLNNLKKSGRKLSSTIIRKIKQIVFNRIVVTKFKGNSFVMRNQKIPIQYHGRVLLLKILDGNPRYLKKFVEFLSDEVIRQNDIEFKIPIQNQASALIKIKDLFLERVKALPHKADKYYNAGKLVEDVGEHLSYNINLDDTWKTTGFKSYIKVRDFDNLFLFEKVFEQAINNGALLVLGDVELEKLHTVKNKELRLNYLLHVEHKLPIRKYYSVRFKKTVRSLPNSIFPYDKH